MSRLAALGTHGTQPQETTLWSLRKMRMVALDTLMQACISGMSPQCEGFLAGTLREHRHSLLVIARRCPPGASEHPGWGVHSRSGCWRECHAVSHHHSSHLPTPSFVPCGTLQDL